MRWSASRLRWLLLGGVLLLAVVVAGFLGVARYRAGKIWQRILTRNGVNLRRETNGITWSQSSRGRTIFTLHASRAVPEGNNKWALHDAVLILYGHQPGRDDRIYGSQFEYDQNAGIARAMGEVHMDLQLPEPHRQASGGHGQPDLGFAMKDPAASDPSVVHVRTSGLVYMRKLGLAATGEAAEFQYRGLTCTSRGAEFDTEHSVIRLLQDVHLSGKIKDSAFNLSASHAELDRSASTADLQAPVLNTKDRSGRAAHALLVLRKDGTLETADAQGGVEIHTATQVLRAPQASASFSADNQPQHARFFAGVRFTDTSPQNQAHGEAETLDLTWAAHGVLQSATADHAAEFGEKLLRKDGTADQSLVKASRAVAIYAPDATRHARLQHLHLAGGASFEDARNGPTAKPTSMAAAADELETSFGVGTRGQPLPQTLHGTGHTRLRQMAEDGTERQSSGDILDVVLVPRLSATSGTEQAQIATAVQTGNVSVETRDPARTVAADQAAAREDVHLTRARAARAVYDGSPGALTLYGDATQRAIVNQAGSELTADQVILHEGTGDAEAMGNVAATSVGAGAETASHILAGSAKLLHASGLSTFTGTPGSPVQLFQGGSRVLADQITTDERKHTLTATPAQPNGRMHAVFAVAGRPRQTSVQVPGGQAREPSASVLGRSGGAGKTENVLPEAERDVVEVSAGRMDYDETGATVLFAGDVVTSGVMGRVRAQKGTAFLLPADAAARDKHAGPGQPGTHAARDSASAQASFEPNLGGRLDRMVMLGDVRLAQPGRSGVGDQLTYTAATDSFVLTGSPGRPPRITGEQGTMVTGATLLFNNAESTIVVAGNGSGGKQGGTGRVHTETDLKQ